MKKEILLYGSIYSWTAEWFITQMQEAEGKDVVLRINTPGGNPIDSYGMIAKFQEHAGKKSIKVDGQASSTGAFMLCFAEADNVECLDVSSFIFHRAAYPQWFEADARLFTEAYRQALESANAQLRAAMESKFTAEQWLKVTGISLDDMFSLDSRIDVTLTAKQAKQLGIVGTIVSITPERKEALKALNATHQVQLAAYAPEGFAMPQVGTLDASSNPQNSNFNNKNQIMTIEKLKAEHPELYAQVVGLGVTQERDRVGAYMAFAHLDLEAVRTAVKDGKVMGETERSEFAIKAYSNAQLGAMSENSAPPVPENQDPNNPKPTAEAQKEAEMAAFNTQVYSALGIAK